MHQGKLPLGSYFSNLIFCSEHGGTRNRFVVIEQKQYQHGTEGCGSMYVIPGNHVGFAKSSPRPQFSPSAASRTFFALAFFLGVNVLSVASGQTPSGQSGVHRAERVSGFGQIAQKLWKPLCAALIFPGLAFGHCVRSQENYSRRKRIPILFFFVFCFSYYD